MASSFPPSSPQVLAFLRCLVYGLWLVKVLLDPLE